jgi:molybdenum cofactor guanylyltransferase
VTVLGAIIAGGRSTRFGEDKGAALLNGRSLIDHVGDGLRSQVDALVIVGRDWPGISRVEDWPESGLGPLGGLSGALRYAAAQGFATVKTAGCDVLPVWEYPPSPALARPHILEGHYLFGHWPVSLAAPLADHISTQSNHSMRHWLEVSGAHFIPADRTHFNLNTKDDLEGYARHLSGHPSQA